MKDETRNTSANNSVAHSTEKGKSKSFADLIQSYNADPTNADTLTALATAVTYSVLHKVIDPTRKQTQTNDRPADSGHNPALIAIKTDLNRDRAYLGNLKYATDHASRLVYNDNGELDRETIDPDMKKAVDHMARETLGDGLDLVNDAVIAILDETEKQREREPGQPVDLERKYTVRRLKKKVWIKSENSVNGWETVETSPISEVYKAVRRCIANSRAVESTSKYCYLEDLSIDPESGDVSTVYRRLPKYADMGSDGNESNPDYIPGQPAGLDGRPVTTGYTADEQTVTDIDETVEKLNLTKRETTVLNYRLSGYGYRAIATAMGISIDNAKRCGRRIREKAHNAGLKDPTEKNEQNEK